MRRQISKNLDSLQTFPKIAQLFFGYQLLRDSFRFREIASYEIIKLFISLSQARVEAANTYHENSLTLNLIIILLH